MYKLNVKKLDPRAKLPTVATPGEDLGYDLYALEDTNLEPGKVTKVRTGIAVEALMQPASWDMSGQTVLNPVQMGLIVKDRSSVASMGVTVSAGVIDAGYRGEVSVLLTNNTPGLQILKAGAKFAQMIPTYVTTGAVEETYCLSELKRGEKGFGSSGAR